MISNRKVFTVAQVNKYVKQTLEADALLAGLFIEGEISNFNPHSSGHLYFVLKDANAEINAVMWRSSAAELPFVPKNGMKVIVFGRVSMYEKTGAYQLYAEFLEPVGIGSLQLALTQLKEKLEKEGLFDTVRKREIPPFAKTVAVITSPTGAAVMDIIRIIKERNPSVKIQVSPAIVQGENAPADIIRALGEVNEYGTADIIILGRGGGSMEDLWAFNDEALARAVANSRIPVISAVGHETDFTICDFVADKRAATPTAAAHMAVFDLRGAQRQLHEKLQTLNAVTQGQINAKKQSLMLLQRQLSAIIKERTANAWQSLKHSEDLLEKISPTAVFKRGYALTRGMDGKAITSAADAQSGQTIQITWLDGSKQAEIKGV